MVDLGQKKVNACLPFFIYNTSCLKAISKFKILTKNQSFLTLNEYNCFLSKKKLYILDVVYI